MPGQKIGTLVVVVAKAKNLLNKRLIGKQDPYCELKLGDQTVRTKAVKRGGQNPEWDEEFRFPIYETAEEELRRTRGKRDGEGKFFDVSYGRARPPKRIMRLSCYADSPRKPDLIGESTIDLTEALTQGELDGYFELTSPTFYRGEVYLEMTYYRSEYVRGGVQQTNQSRHDQLGAHLGQTPLPSPATVGMIGDLDNQQSSQWVKLGQAFLGLEHQGGSLNPQFNTISDKLPLNPLLADHTVPLPPQMEYRAPFQRYRLVFLRG
ncbi:hypothetical protein FS837_007411 [Tulasnella sp. UAMH 9824]|nr:hypothetical protein FS837_007411 [Tulasnella sp. UAMH 9824]